MNEHLRWLALHSGILAAVIMFIGVGGPGLLARSSELVAHRAQTAAAFFVTSITAGELETRYQASTSPAAAPEARRVRVLIVPGHQPESGGTEFKGVYERDVVADIASELADLIAKNPHYDVVVARGKTAWNPILRSYFDTHAAEIATFRDRQAAEMNWYLRAGNILPQADQVYHNAASATGSLELYGINKWSSDNHYDLVLHLHLNDYAGRKASSVGKYDGFAVYVPDHQYSNAAASLEVGRAIAHRLSAYHATSTLPREDKGVVEDQELIAIGSNNTVSGAAALIEYGYIYEPQFRNADTRSVVVRDYAYATYLGLQDFFKDSVADTRGTETFPLDWATVSLSENGSGVYGIQAALRALGAYPPKGKTLSDCPVSGVAGACTVAALKQFQAAHGLEAAGTFGPQTRAALISDLTKRGW